MKTNLAYIDNVMDRAVDGELARPTIPDSKREEAAKKGRKIIGGFRVHDEAEERKALDDMIAKRRESILKFRDDRAKVCASLSALGVSPLAVCPTGAWYKICKDTGLFILSPDKQGRIGIAPNWAEGVKKPEYTDRWQHKDLLRHMFPDGVSLVNSTHRATLVLPDPPKDVADILCKVQSRTLTVAAVGEAIRFAEKPSELTKANAHPKDQWAQAQGYEDYADWLKRDPIIFTEHESATAIIAQFGDFPIEKEVVDAATKADNLISDRPQALEAVSLTSLSIGTTSYGISNADDQYRRMMMQQMAQSRDIEMQRAMAGQYNGLFGR